MSTQKLSKMAMSKVLLIHLDHPHPHPNCIIIIFDIFFFQPNQYIPEFHFFLKIYNRLHIQYLEKNLIRTDIFIKFHNKRI